MKKELIQQLYQSFEDCAHEEDGVEYWLARELQVLLGYTQWRNFEAVEFATLEWVDWFNHRRILEPIGNIPPAEAEERYYAMLEEPALAA